MEDWNAVQQVYKQTKSKRETAKILGISRNTVRRLLEMKEKPRYHREVYHSKLDCYKERIIEWRCSPYEFNGTRIYRELQDIGYTGSIGPLYRYLRKVDEDISRHINSKATVRHESPPGDQAQFDWTEYNVWVGGILRKVYCFSMILSASRKKAICFSLTVDGEAIYDAIQELFSDLGGVTLELLIDNPKALVLEHSPKSEEDVKYNPHALLLAKHLSTELNACPCFWPRKKGKVESPFKYIEEQFIKGNQFASMEDLNHRGKSFIDEWCNTVHGTTRRIPNQHYLLEEKSTLLPLPDTYFRVKKLEKRKISLDSFIHIKGSKYSVPVEYVGKTVFYRIRYGFRIEIYDDKDTLILHIEKSEKKHDVVSNMEHYSEITPKVSTSIPQIRRDFTVLFMNGAKYLEIADKIFDQPTHHARRIMELLDLYDKEVLNELIGKAIEKNSLDIKSFKALLREYNRGDLLLSSSKDVGIIPSKEEAPSLERDCSYYEKIKG